jgi:hypothetical protein
LFFTEILGGSSYMHTTSSGFTLHAHPPPFPLAPQIKRIRAEKRHLASSAVKGWAGAAQETCPGLPVPQSRAGVRLGGACVYSRRGRCACALKDTFSCHPLSPALGQPPCRAAAARTDRGFRAGSARFDRIPRVPRAAADARHGR